MAIQPAHILEALAGIDSPTIANAIESFRVRDPTAGYASLAIRCLTADLPPMVGYAFTVTADSATPLPKRPNREPELYEALLVAPKPSIVVIKDVGPNPARSCHAGDNLSSIFQRLGAVGLVTDGGIRDLSGIRQRAPGFHVYSPGLVVSHGVPTFLEFGQTVSIGGMTVRPGDLIHGDENGLVVVPEGTLPELVNRARAILEREKELVSFIKGAAFSLPELIRRMYGDGAGH